MKTIILALLLAFAGINSHSQKVTFGKIDKADLESKKCAYDPDAPAECLYDYGEVNYFINSNSFTNERIVWARIKIYDQKELDRANIKIPYYTSGNRMSVIKIQGYTYNINESGEIERTELEKKSIYEQKINNNFNEMVFSLPNVKVGSVFEYRYTVIKKDIFELDNWVFQQRIPVRMSYYDVGIPSVLGFNYRVIKRQPVEEKSEDGTLGARRKIFVMKEIPGLKNEPYMSSSNDYFQRVEFQLSGVNGRPLPSATWKGFADLLLEDEDFGLQLKKNVLNKLPIQADLAVATSAHEKIRIIYNYVKNNIAWNGNNSFWSSEGVKNALEKHEGNSADINLLLINLLRDAGIKAYPVLVSTRSHGKVNSYFPFRSQFDNVYAYVPGEKETFVLDATSKHNPFFITPWDVQFTMGFLVDKEKVELLELGDIKNKFQITTITQSEIKTDGTAMGTSKTYASGYAKVERLSAWNRDKKAFKEKYYTSQHKEFSFDSVEVNYNKNDDSSTLECFTKFKTELTQSGEYLFYNINLLSGLTENPFLAEERISSIEFGYNQSIILTGSVLFPDNLELEELPKNVKMIMPDSSVTMQRIMQKEGNNLSYRITLNINKPLYFPDEYPDFKAFFDAVMEMLNEQLVFKKKATPLP